MFSARVMEDFYAARVWNEQKRFGVANVRQNFPLSDVKMFSQRRTTTSPKGFRRNEPPFVKKRSFRRSFSSSLKKSGDDGFSPGAEPWDPSKNDGELDPIRNEVLLRIVQSEISDEEVNKLVWRCLGYETTIELDPETLTATETWRVSNKVFPNWAKRFPEPPDVIGVTRKYYPEIDQPVKEACASLTRSVSSEYKNGLKEQLKPLGWKGFKMEGLTPNMTRRAQAANWLVYYRSELRGVPIEELKRRRELRRLKEIEEGEEKKPTGGSTQSVV